MSMCTSVYAAGKDVVGYLFFYMNIDIFQTLFFLFFTINISEQVCDLVCYFLGVKIIFKTE